jgi:hypothetical protein
VEAYDLQQAMEISTSNLSTMMMPKFTLDALKR